jgi:hypothetical protein
MHLNLVTDVNEPTELLPRQSIVGVPVSTGLARPFCSTSIELARRFDGGGAVVCVVVAFSTNDDDLVPDKDDDGGNETERRSSSAENGGPSFSGCFFIGLPIL